MFLERQLFWEAADQKQKPNLVHRILGPTEMNFRLNLCHFQADTIIIYTKKSYFLFLEKHFVKWKERGTSLVVQWSRVHLPVDGLSDANPSDTV